jgi:hypothetical protein
METLLSDNEARMLNKVPEVTTRPPLFKTCA